MNKLKEGVLADPTASTKLPTLIFEHAPTGKKVQFKAFITKFSDKYESAWDAEDVLGRMDPIQTFKSTKRSISLGWDVVAGHEAEAKANMENMSELVSMLYPTYETGAILSAPLIRVKFANWVTTPSGTGLLGAVSGVSFDPLMEDLFFHDTGKKMYPKVIQLACTLTVVHEHALGYDAASNEKQQGAFPYNMSKATSVAPVGQQAPADTIVPIRTEQATEEELALLDQLTGVKW